MLLTHLNTYSSLSIIDCLLLNQENKIALQVIVKRHSLSLDIFINLLL